MSLHKVAKHFTMKFVLHQDVRCKKASKLCEEGGIGFQLPVIIVLNAEDKEFMLDIHE